MNNKSMRVTWIVLLLVCGAANAVVAIASAAHDDYSKGVWHLMLAAISAYAAKLESKDD